MAGKFILSLDCEGKWGVADHLDQDIHRTLSDRRLREAYANIAKILDEFDIDATFAIVGLFELPQAELMRLPLPEIAQRLPYTSGAVADITDGTNDGWSADWLDDYIDQRHERASHGVSHTPFDELDDEQFDYEFSLVDGIGFETIIFPRNAVAHLPKLANMGVRGYRAKRPGGAIGRLISEALPFAEAEDAPAAPAPGAMVEIPAGHFINWKKSARRFIPNTVTAMRSRAIMKDASRRNGVAHFWTHPENIAAAPGTLHNFRNICAIAAEMRDAGKLDILTQANYVADINEQAAKETAA